MNLKALGGGAAVVATALGVILNIHVHSASTYKSPATLYAEAQAYCSLANFPLRGTGTIHYFCNCATGAQTGCQAGNDSDDGLAPTPEGGGHGPKASWGQVMSTWGALSAGDTIALCQGGAWPSTGGTFANGSCGSAAPYTEAQIKNPANTTLCDIRDYSPVGWWNGTNKPLITMSGSGVWAFSFDDDSRGVRILNLETRGTVSTLANTNGSYCPTPGDQWGIDVGAAANSSTSDFLVCGNTFANLCVAIHYISGGIDSSPYVNAYRWWLWGNTITMNSLDAIGVWVVHHDWVIDANLMDNVGLTGGQQHVIYMGYALAGNPSSNLRFTNNRLLRTGAVSGTVPQCAAVISKATYGSNDGTLYENNILDGGAGQHQNCMALVSGPDTDFDPPVFERNFVFRGNWVNTSQGLEFNQTSGALVENNVFTGLGQGAAYGEAICAPYHPIRSGDDAVTAFTLRNNTFYYSAPAGTGIEVGGGTCKGVVVPTMGTNHIISNNTSYMTGSARGNCFGFGADTSQFTFWNNNACYNFQYWDGINNRSLAQFQAATNFDLAGVSTNPLYTNAPTDFKPQAGSPLNGAGNHTNAPVRDIYLKTRPNPPAIGAVER